MRRVDGPVCHCIVRTSIATFERWEKLGLDRVKSGLMTGGRRDVGDTPKVREMAWEWVRMKEGRATLPAGKRAGTRGGLPLLAGSRIDDLRNLSSPDFDFRKLIRLCEELNTAYNNGCYFAALSNGTACSSQFYTGVATSSAPCACPKTRKPARSASLVRHLTPPPDFRRHGAMHPRFGSTCSDMS